MAKDILFLLNHGFSNPSAGPDPYYCSECAVLEGLLVYHPELNKRIDVKRIAFPRPRAAIIELLGPDLQSAPVLVVGDETASAPGIGISPVTGKRYVSGLKDIAEYLATTYGVTRLYP